MDVESPHGVGLGSICDQLAAERLKNCATRFLKMVPN